MLFYITESIGGTRYYEGKKFQSNHVKVGIATDVEQRFKEYNIIFPQISAVRQIYLSKSFGKKLEKMFKYYLASFRIWNSECYAISPNEAIFFLSRCYISTGKVIVNYLYKYGKYLFYLDSIYFGKKIPLFIIKNIRKYKKDSAKKNHQIDLIKDWSPKKTKIFLDETYRKHNYEEVIEDTYNFSKNILYHLLKRRLDRIQLQINTWDNLGGNVSSVDFVDFFSDQMFLVVRDYYKIFKNNKNKKKKFIKDFDFFGKKLESAKSLLPDDREGYLVRKIKNKYFYSLSYMLDKRGTPSKKKNDPYQFTTDSTWHWNSFQATEKDIASLLRPSKKITRVG
tara:strand:+ start:378 stop:1391 length:1014 start_codon:yes stop_codon:yes gene_type:complete